MSTEDTNYRKMWNQLTNSLKEVIDSKPIDVKLLVNSFDTKIKEINGLIKETKKLNKEKDKLNSELETMKKAIIKANSNISKGEDKRLEMEEYIEKMMKKTDENKENVENVMNLWNTLGLRIEKKDQLLTIKFNKISESDPNKWVSVQIKLEDNNKIKIIECNPKDLLDPKPIEDQLNNGSEQSKLDLRYLIVYIHKILKKTNSN